MTRLWTSLKKVSTITVLLVAMFLVLKTLVHMPLFSYPERGNNITTCPPVRRNADTLTLFYAAQSQDEGRVHTKEWRGKILSTLGMDGRGALPINVPINLLTRDWRDLDLMKVPNLEFLPNFKNPCWRESYKPKVTCQAVSNQRLGGESKQRYPVDYLRCLPYFYIIGQPKCGTTDVYSRLNKHPDVVAPKIKESFWIERVRFSHRCSSINTYLDFQRASTRTIETAVTRNKSGILYHHKITGDGTVDTMWDNSLWPLLPGNEGCQEPCVTNADIIHHLYPQAKIVVCFRNPVERVYSDFLYETTWLHYNISKEHFHKNVLQQIDMFTTCLKTKSPRACVYNGSHENAVTSKVRLRQGLYFIHLSDWLRVFPRHQIHIIKFEDYVQNTEQELKQLFKFLELRELTEEEMNLVLDVKAKNTRKESARAVGAMLNDTRKILTDFYEDYNKNLSILLDDTRFLWE